MTKKVMVTIAIAVLMMVPCMFLALADAPAEADTMPPPAGLQALRRGQDASIRVALTWDAVEGAYGYNVYRSDTPDGPLARIGGKAADSMLYYPVFLDDGVEPGRGYFYAVSSVDEDLDEGPFSSRVYAFVDAAARAAAGPKSIVCSLSDQRLYFFEGDQLVNITRCSTGLNNRTPTGHFRILSHTRMNVGLGGAVCDYWMAFTSAHGMHSWPRVSRTYETGLGAPASHGCIRQHPMEAYWPYYWAPNGTPLTVTYASLGRRTIAGCHSSGGAAVSSPVWYFAEGYTAEGYDTYLLLSNPGEAGIEAQVSYQKESGEVVEHLCAIAPHSRHTIAVDGIPGMDAAAFSMRVDANGPIVAERAMYFAAGRKTDGTVSLGVTQPSPDWYFAEGYTAESFDTYLLLSNPGDDVVHAWVHFFLDDGETYEHGLRIEPHSRYTVMVDSLPVVGATSFSMQVHADGPVVAERAMYFTKGYIHGGHASAGAPRPSHTWFFAEGCTRQFFQSYILLGNPGVLDTIVAIDYLLSGTNLRYEYLVKAHSRMTIPVASQGGLEGTDMAFTVYSTEPIVAERAVYYDLDSHRGGHAAMGSPQASLTWYFAEGYTDGAFDTYILLSNPTVTPANVEVAFQRDDGAVFTRGYAVPPLRRATVHADEIPGLERASFSTVVRSDVPVMAERAMYFVMARGY